MKLARLYVSATGALGGTSFVPLSPFPRCLQTTIATGMQNGTAQVERIILSRRCNWTMYLQLSQLRYDGFKPIE